MALPVDLTRAPVVAFDRIESLADPGALSSILGPLSRVDHEPPPWYLAVNSTRLARGKDEVIARYRELLESKLGEALHEGVWERMLTAGVVSGARMLPWSKALACHEGTASRRADWNWWAARLTRWSRG